MTRDEGWQLLYEWIAGDSLRKHALAVEAAMRFYAGKLGGDVEQWGLVGLLHDMDYERFPEPPAHAQKCAEELARRGLDEEIVGAVLAHANWMHDKFPLDRPIRKTIWAVDELTGFVIAVALVRPSKALSDLAAKSVKKKLKEKSFAAAVDREQIAKGAELLGVSLDEHIDNVIAAIRPIAKELGLAG
ncbi:MAG: HDIG domain-containing protein [Phycisphaerae bacterium]|nr:HDIG domain-containing protein [Phycisphaerae bacterium]